jgi:hypothetical protein
VNFARIPWIKLVPLEFDGSGLDGRDERLVEEGFLAKALDSNDFIELKDRGRLDGERWKGTRRPRHIIITSARHDQISTARGRHFDEWQQFLLNDPMAFRGPGYENSLMIFKLSVQSL